MLSFSTPPDRHHVVLRCLMDMRLLSLSALSGRCKRSSLICPLFHHDLLPILDGRLMCNVRSVSKHNIPFFPLFSLNACQLPGHSARRRHTLILLSMTCRSPRKVMSLQLARSAADPNIVDDVLFCVQVLWHWRRTRDVGGPAAHACSLHSLACSRL